MKITKWNHSAYQNKWSFPIKPLLFYYLFVRYYEWRTLLFSWNLKSSFSLKLVHPPSPTHLDKQTLMQGITFYTNYTAPKSNVSFLRNMVLFILLYFVLHWNKLWINLITALNLDLAGPNTNLKCYMQSQNSV